MAYETLASLLEQRIRTDGGSPFVTFYDLGSGERTELSAVTFGNWVDKTAGFARDELDLQIGDSVHIVLPLHWQTLVWWAACARAGLVITDDTANVHVVGPEESQWALARASGARQIVALSLQPWGRGFTIAPPAPIVDFADQVRLSPDVFAEPPPAAQGALLQLTGVTLRNDELADLAAERVRTTSRDPRERILVADVPVAATDLRYALVDLLMAPLMTEASLVIVRHADAGNLDSVASQEQTNAFAQSSLPVRPD